MFGLGKLLALPVRLINLPMTLADKLMDGDDDKERMFSAPLESLAETVEEAVDGED